MSSRATWTGVSSSLAMGAPRVGVFKSPKATGFVSGGACARAARFSICIVMFPSMIKACNLVNSSNMCKTDPREQQAHRCWRTEKAPIGKVPEP